MFWCLQIIEANLIFRVDSDGTPLEVSLAKNLRHPNVLQVLDYATCLRKVSPPLACCYSELLVDSESLLLSDKSCRPVLGRQTLPYSTRDQKEPSCLKVMSNAAVSLPGDIGSWAQQLAGQRGIVLGKERPLLKQW